MCSTFVQFRWSWTNIFCQQIGRGMYNKTEKSFSLIGCAKHDNFLPLYDWLVKDEMFTSLATDIDCMMYVLRVIQHQRQLMQKHEIPFLYITSQRQLMQKHEIPSFYKSLIRGN